MQFFRKKDRFSPIYAIVLKGNRHPTEEEVGMTIALFVQSGRLEEPSDDSRIARLYDPDMEIGTTSGRFLTLLYQEG